MKIKHLLLMSFFICINIQCNKSDSSLLHTARVINATCPSINFNGVVVQLNYRSAQSFSYTDAANGAVYNNAVVSVDSVLRRSVGKTFTFSVVSSSLVNDFYCMMGRQPVYFEGVKIEQTK